MPFNVRFTNTPTIISLPSSPPLATIPLPRSRSFFSRRRPALFGLFLVSFLLYAHLVNPGLTFNAGGHAHTQLDRFSSWGYGGADQWGGDRMTSWSWSAKFGRLDKECRGWDPAKPEEQDPKNCLKARQYRQTQRVLAREIRDEHDNWYFTRDHNIETLRNISNCFLPTSDPSFTPCHEKPLVVSGWWYTAEVLNGATTGEVIWQRAVVKQLKMLGYDFIAVGPYLNWVEVAEMMPDVYVTLWSGDLDVVSCLTDPRCVAKEHYIPPEGEADLSIGVPDEERGVIPLWALNVVDYWGSTPRDVAHNAYWWGLQTNDEWSFNPLGQQWVATPWPLPGHFHIPYSIEEQCLPLPIAPQHERRDAALIFAKRSSYFDYHHVSPPSFWTNLSADPSFELLSTAEIEESHPLPEGLTSMGPQTVEDYEKLVGSVKVLIGMGAPRISPSVYTALCQATPVVIPYFIKDFSIDGWNMYSGYAQHGPAMSLGEPYVYKYYAQNYTDLEDTIHRAMATPIERYIPDDMKLEFALSELQKYLSRDLEAMAAEAIAANGGKVPSLVAGARKRCYELERCRPPLPAGRLPYHRRQATLTIMNPEEIPGGLR